MTLAPQSSSNLALVGRLLPQEFSTGLATVSGVFNNFVHGKDTNVQVRGANVQPSEVGHLPDNAFQTLA